MIQALELGKPVLVPDRGLLGYRVRENNLGDVYSYENLADLRRKAEKLWRSDLSQFSARARSFWQRFSDESIRGFFAERLLGSPVLMLVTTYMTVYQSAIRTLRAIKFLRLHKKYREFTMASVKGFLA